MKPLLYYTKSYRIHIILAVLASVACSVVNVKVIDILQQVIDMTMAGELGKGLVLLLFQIGVVVVLGLLANYLVVATTGYFGAGVLRDLRKDSLQHLMKISPASMEASDFGDVMERLSSDIETLAGYMQTYFKDCLYVPVIVIVFAIYLIRLNPALAFICLLPLAVLVPLSTKLLKPVKLSQAEYVKRLGYTNNHIQEAFDGADVIKAYNLQERMEEKYEKALKETFKLANKNDLKQYNVLPFSEMVREVPTAIALCVGGYLVFQGEMTLGMMIAFLSAIQKLNQPLVNAYQLVIRTQMAMVAVNRVFALMEIPEEPEPEPIKMKQSGENVFTFSDVSFSYRNQGANVAIEGLNLAIKKGTRVALVGRSGSGKSTLLKLLARQYEEQKGDIFYYKHKYSDMSPNRIRADMALISQDAVLFPISVFDNIRIGNPTATRTEIVQAARLAGCDEFIQNMERGYESILDEKGSNLSGGQRQRIAIARAIIKDAPILLLDEPTSALDRETEEHINQTISEIAKNKTVINVAHRLSTIEDYDEIIVLEDGKIVEQGTQEELMRKGGSYYHMYSEYMRTGGVIA